ncbi:hypothetical protein [Prosthecobacter sp.]|uniref:hypothetical protein n=1 Tax=Prosthecobacter sp. TaxID=1965333 RepID=UPI0037851719
MATLRTRILTSLAVLAVACAQVFGLQRGFLCDCGGVQEVTQADHCHGPHSAACHDEEKAAPCHSSDDHPDSEDTHEHPAIVESLTASQASVIQIAAPAPVLVDLVIPEWILSVLLPAQVSMVAEAPPWLEHERGRTWPQVLAHTIVLRV